MIESKYEIRKSVSDGNINRYNVSESSGGKDQVVDFSDESILADCSIDSVFIEESGVPKITPAFNQGRTYRIINQDRR